MRGILTYAEAVLEKQKAGKYKWESESRLADTGRITKNRWTMTQDVWSFEADSMNVCLCIKLLIVFLSILNF